MTYLKDFQLRRDGAYVVVQWAGAPRFTVGVYSTATDSQAFAQAARAIERGDRLGLHPDELAECVIQIRRRLDESRPSAARGANPE